MTHFFFFFFVLLYKAVEKNHKADTVQKYHAIDF